MARREKPYLRLVVDNTRPPQPKAQEHEPPREPLSENTIEKHFYGPFAHLRAALTFEDFEEWGAFQLVGWTRFAWSDPRTWFYSRIEAVNCLNRANWTKLERYVRYYFGRGWRLHRPHRFA